MPALLFGGKLADFDAVSKTLLAFIGFCLISSTVYVVNDISDRKKDSYHPVKKNRPLASGKISPVNAIIYAVCLAIVSFILSYKISLPFACVVLFYLAMQILYSFVLKNVAILDVIIIASGFVLRAIGGAIAIKLPFTSWLVMCIFSLCLFMGFCKRMNELAVLGTGQVSMHRKTLLEYSPELLSHLISVSAGIAIVTFMLYSLSSRAVSQFGTSAFIYTVPVVIYCIFRFAALSMMPDSKGQSEMLVSDLPLMTGVIIWLIMAVIIVLKGKELSTLYSSFYV